MPIRPQNFPRLPPFISLVPTRRAAIQHFSGQWAHEETRNESTSNAKCAELLSRTPLLSIACSECALDSHELCGVFLLVLFGLNHYVLTTTEIESEG
ncbi:hypothetical protein E2C01_076456 [Portunus trituberculatus]|uniref:Uncharacterized protein n=1 Tax=Portunus trituberculatus TaxID=210409 RepID=A0A5B7I8S5_PORTR|nr:hypothetical protein [Portunus trituberculatus]